MDTPSRAEDGGSLLSREGTPSWRKRFGHNKNADIKLKTKLLESRPDEIVKCSKGHDNTKTAKICWKCGEELH
jgi:hypothetical protein